MKTHRVLVLSLVLVVGCSSTAPSATTSTKPTATTAATTALLTTIATTTTAPSTTTTLVAVTTVPTTAATAASIEAIAQQLLDRYDAAATAILIDPRVASNPANPKVLAYLALFPANSAFAKGTVEFWAQEGAQGRFYKPNSDGKLFVSTLNKVIAESTTEATVFVCTVQTITVVSETGTPLESTGGVVGGEVVLVKSGDQWLLRDLTRKPAGDCPKPGSGG
jgi:hypothetical protein